MKTSSSLLCMQSDPVSDAKEEETACINCGRCVSAVSYTHLDVYKRQPLVGMLMLGNLFRECGVVKQLTETASNALMYIVVILLGTSVGASTSAEAFLNVDTLKIVVLGLVAFACGTFGGVMLGKVMCKLTGCLLSTSIRDTGARVVTYGAPVLPGAMLLIAYYEKEGKCIPILGLPGCCLLYTSRCV